MTMTPASLCALAGVLLALGGAPAAAALPSQFGELGSGAGQFHEAVAVSVHQATGDVYLVDRQNNRVDEFSGEGQFIRAWGWGVADGVTSALQMCTATCFPGIPGSGAGQFDSPVLSDGIAVDSLGDVYVLDNNNSRVEKFSPEGQFDLEFAVSGTSLAVGAAGTVYVGEENAVHEYTAEGESIRTLALEGAGVIVGLEVDVLGDIFAVGNQQVHEYEGTTGLLVRTFELQPGLQAEAVALGPQGGAFEGDVFVGASNGSEERQFRLVAFDGTAKTLAVFDRGVVSNASVSEGRSGMAFGETLSTLYIPTNLDDAGQPLIEHVRVVVPPSPGPLVERPVAGEIGSTSAVIRANIIPETGEASDETHYRVEYGTTVSYGLSAPSPEGALPGSFDGTAIEVSLTELLPRTTYHYRVVATDECEREKGVRTTCSTDGADETFTTLPPALIESESVTDVRSTSATLGARIDPLGRDTTYHFVYGPTSACGGVECSVPVPDGDIGSGGLGVEVAPEHLQGLSPGTVYHYRVVADNALGTTEGELRSFTTQIAGEAGLPDGRAWELVSPPDKHGAPISISPLGYELFQASASGDAISWPAGIATEAQPQGQAERMQVLSTRGASAWSSADLEVRHAKATSVYGVMEYTFFSQDLSLGLMDPFGAFEPSLSPEASEQTPYVRTMYVGGDPNHRCVEACFHPLVTGADVPSGTVFAPDPAAECVPRCGPLFVAATPDLRHVILRSKVALTPNAINEYGLYEWTAGKLVPISLMPANSEGVEAPPIPPQLGFGEFVMTHAISNDGSRVFWEAGELNHNPYMRDTVRNETIAIGPGPFEGASADGSKVFAAGHECDVQLGEASGKLECLPSGEPYTHLLGASEDGSWVYVEREGGLYVRHAGVTRLIAGNVGGLGFPGDGDLRRYHWRVSPNGEWFAFMSDSSLTGYDNRDAVTGVADEEVYLYDAQRERLLCASCDPTGARPRGLAFGAGSPFPEGSLIAASVPGWTPYELAIALYQSRYLSDEGRLFFNARDALVPKDVNGQQDVYEFEPEGLPAGSHACTPASTSGSVVFVAAAKACVGLISSGESPEEAVFLDASESGGDVFFLSTAPLTPQAIDGSNSVFDAHECTLGSPCLPPFVAPLRPCDNESSCKAPSLPQPTIFGASGSATFSGSGNPAPPSSPGPVHAAETRAHQLAKALKLCKKHYKRGARRVVCERRARRRYHATGAKRAKTVRGRTR
jgi:hypothetical protein